MIYFSLVFFIFIFLSSSEILRNKYSQLKVNMLFGKVHLFLFLCIFANNFKSVEWH